MTILNIFNCHQADAIRTSPKLDSLEINSCSLTAKHMQTLGAALMQSPVPPLTKLKLDHNRSLGVDGAKHVVRALCLLPTLRDLSYADCGAAGEAGAERFAIFVKSSKFCKLECVAPLNMFLSKSEFLF